jgi:hypothetical protein
MTPEKMATPSVLSTWLHDEAQQQPEGRRGQRQQQHTAEGIFQRRRRRRTALILPDHLEPGRVGDGGDEHGDDAQQRRLYADGLRLFQVDEHDAGEDQRREEEAAHGHPPPKEGEHDGRHQNGQLPGGGQHPTGGKAGGEGDAGVKNTKADCAGHQPEAGSPAQLARHVSQHIKATLQEQNHDEQQRHPRIAQRRRPEPMAAAKAHEAVEEKGAAKEEGCQQPQAK